MAPEPASPFPTFGVGRIPIFLTIRPGESRQSSSYTPHCIPFYPPPDQKMRVDWTPYDLTSPSGRKIEVKSAAYLQSWDQEYYSKILWDIAPKRAWSPSDGYSPEVKRHSDLYVFCLYTALTRDQSILNLDLWEFYVLPTRILDEKMPTQKKISLPSLLKLMPVKASFAELGNAIETTELLRT